MPLRPLGRTRIQVLRSRRNEIILTRVWFSPRDILPQPVRDIQHDRPGRRLSALRIAAVYALCVAAWIIFSDTLVDLIDLPILHTFKGLAFVAVSSTILYAYLRRKMADHAAIEQALEATAESKTRLLSAVSHDLRQPLQSLSLFVSVIQSDANLSPRSRMAADNLGQSVQRMGQLLDSLLRLVEVDIGLLKGRRQAVALNALIAELAQEMTPQAETKGLCLKWAPTSAVVDSDPALLLTVLRNLVANAIRYTETGKVLIGCRNRGRCVEIGVYDTGVGIDADKLKLVFEEFYQVGNQARDSRLGLGLGLSIVDRLSRLLGLQVVVRSKKGKGSAFCVIAPRAPL